MGLLNHIKKSLNVGGVKILVALDDEVHGQGERVRGRLFLRGGDYDVEPESVSMELREYWTESYYDGEYYQSHTIAEPRARVAWTTGVIRAGSELVVDFDMPLPPDARWTTSDTGWDLYVRVDVPAALDPTGSFTLQVVPGRQILALTDTLEREMRFEERVSKRKWKEGVSAFRFRPPHALRSELDALEARVSQRADGGVGGILVLNLQEQSIGDYFNALLGKDDVYVAVDLSFAELVDNHGLPQPNLKATLATLLREVLENPR